MKLTILLLITVVLQVSASTYAQQVSLSEKNAPLEQVFFKIRAQTGYDFLFTTSLLKGSKPVNINVKNASLSDVLKQVFEGQPLDFSIEDKSVVVSQKQETVLQKIGDFFAIPVDFNGRVVDSTGTPLPGASIFIKAGRKSATTDANGKFSLKGVEVGAVLEISYIGYLTQQVTVTRDNAVGLTIVLKADIGKLQEVAVVSNGYQTIAKERSAGSFSKPDMTTVANRSTSMNILQRLDGLIPGLTINNAPGQSGSPYLLRGLTSVSISSTPLYVVDGIQQPDLSNVNPQDISDITVLKDATAASIWGSRASNGVIVIVTKKGTKGDKIKVNYDAFVNFQGKPNVNYFPVLNSQQFIQAARETFDPVFYPYTTVTLPTAGAGLAPHEAILYDQYAHRTDPAYVAKTNAQLDSLASISNNDQIKNLFYRNAMLMNHTLSISGGQKNYTVYGSMAYTDTRSSSPGQSNDTYKINLRQDFNVGSRVQLGLITDLTNNLTYAPRNISPTDQFYPYQLFQDAAGNNISMPYMTTLPDATRIDYETRSRINLDYNPLNEVGLGYTKGNMLQSRNIFTANVKLIDGLTFEGTYGYITTGTRTQDFDDQQAYKVRAQVVQFAVPSTTAGAAPTYNLPATGANYSVTNLTQRNWTVRNQLSYNKSWKNGLHQLTMLGGQEAQEQYSVTNVSSVKGWNPLLQTSTAIDYKTVTGLVNNVVWPNYAATYSLLSGFTYSGEQEAPISRFESYYANAAYTFNHKYTVNGSYRIDQSNNFGIDKAAQNKPVWSVGGKWLMSEEAFIKPVVWLNSLALRATYGITGNAPVPGTAASYDIISVSASSFLPNSQGLQIATPANRKLTWESTATINIGLDFAVLKNRLSGAIDIYRKKTTNLLGNVTTDGFTGYPTIFGNIGDLENKGMELSINSVNIRSKNFSWSTMLNGAYNKNVITSLNISAPVTTGAGAVAQTNQFATGYPGYAIFAYQFAGLDNLGDPQIRLADGTVTKTPGVSKPGDIKYMGSSQPPWSGGLSNNFTYKSFGLNFNAIFNLGHVMRRDVDNFYTGRLTHSGLGAGFATGNINAAFANRWKQPGDELITNIPSYVSNSNTSATRRDVSYYTNADINVVSASYIKMRDITLTYSLPQFLAKKINADAITLRAQVSNLMLWKANKDGIDPEFQYAYFGTRTMPTGQGEVSFGLNVRL